MTEADMPCLCAPTTHAGSFRCRLHRSNSWGGRTIPKPRTSGSDLEVSTGSLIENSLLQEDRKPVLTPPMASSSTTTSSSSSSSSFSRSPSARSPPTGGSRLRNVVYSSDEEDEAPLPITERMASMKMATGTGGSFASAPGGRAAMFRMLKTGQSTSNIFS